MTEETADINLASANIVEKIDKTSSTTRSASLRFEEGFAATNNNVNVKGKSLTWSGIGMSVDAGPGSADNHKKIILESVDGKAEVGRLTAIMGHR